MQGQHSTSVKRQGSGSKVYACPWKLAADLYAVPAGTTFVCGNTGLISLGKILARFNRPNDQLKFVLAPPDERVAPMQSRH